MSQSMFLQTSDMLHIDISVPKNASYHRITLAEMDASHPRTETTE